MGTIDREMRGDPDGNHLAAGEVVHLRGDGDERARELTEAAEVLDVLEEGVWFAVERVRAVPGDD
jgi:LmbE family N-acetylglucosaminyl deacetylase